MIAQRVSNQLQKNERIPQKFFSTTEMQAFFWLSNPAKTSDSAYKISTDHQKRNGLIFGSVADYFSWWYRNLEVKLSNLHSWALSIAEWWWYILSHPRYFCSQKKKKKNWIFLINGWQPKYSITDHSLYKSSWLTSAQAHVSTRPAWACWRHRHSGG